MNKIYNLNKHGMLKYELLNKKNNFFLSYSKNGYFITNPLFDDNELFNLREDLDKELKFSKEGARIGIEKIQNQNLLKKIIEIFSSNEIKYIAEQTELSLDKNTFMLPLFEIHKNLHVNPKESIGWHKDCGGETKYEYCKNILYDKKYFFPKIGIYLQKNEEYGGCIDIIKLSHKKNIISKIKTVSFILVGAVHKYFNSLYFAFPEKMFMFFLGAQKLNPKVGSAVIFDSRIIHRGSPIEKHKIKHLNFIKGKNYVTVPEKKEKYSLYCQFGTSDAVDSYFYDRLKRKNNANEINVWLKQVDIIKKIDKNFGEKMEQILTPIIKKYL